MLSKGKRKDNSISDVILITKDIIYSTEKKTKN